MYSIVIKIAIDVRRAVELVNTIPKLGLINDIVDIEKADPDPIKISVIIKNTFYSLKLLLFLLHYSVSILSDFNICS